MPEGTRAKTGAQRSIKSTTGTASRGFTDDERAAMRERAYGMPAYAKDGEVVCFFQSAHKFKSRYAALGFSDEANLDDGGMWPTSFGLKEVTAADEARIGALVKKAVS